MQHQFVIRTALAFTFLFLGACNHSKMGTPTDSAIEGLGTDTNMGNPEFDGIQWSNELDHPNYIWNMDSEAIWYVEPSGNRNVYVKCGRSNPCSGPAKTSLSGYLNWATTRDGRWGIFFQEGPGTGNHHGKFVDLGDQFSNLRPTDYQYADSGRKMRVSFEDGRTAYFKITGLPIDAGRGKWEGFDNGRIEAVITEGIRAAFVGFIGQTPTKSIYKEVFVEPKEVEKKSSADLTWASELDHPNYMWNMDSEAIWYVEPSGNRSVYVKCDRSNPCSGPAKTSLSGYLNWATTRDGHWGIFFQEGPGTGNHHGKFVDLGDQFSSVRPTDYQYADSGRKMRVSFEDGRKAVFKITGLPIDAGRGKWAGSDNGRIEAVITEGIRAEFIEAAK